MDGLSTVVRGNAMRILVLLSGSEVLSVGEVLIRGALWSKLSFVVPIGVVAVSCSRVRISLHFVVAKAVRVALVRVLTHPVWVVGTVIGIAVRSLIATVVVTSVDTWV